MMLVLVLGTTLAFSSCSKDDDDNNGGGGGAAGRNSIVLNGTSHNIKECIYGVYSGKKTIVVVFEDKSAAGECDIIFNGNVPTGNATADGVKLDYAEAGGSYKGTATAAPCAVSLDLTKKTCSCSISGVKVSVTNKASETKDVTVSLNYSGAVGIDM